MARVAHSVRRDGAREVRRARVGSAGCRCAGSGAAAVRTESRGRKKKTVGSLMDGSHMSARERGREARVPLGWRKLGRLLATRREEKRREGRDFGLLAH